MQKLLWTKKYIIVLSLSGLPAYYDIVMWGPHHVVGDPTSICVCMRLDCCTYLYLYFFVVTNG